MALGFAESAIVADIKEIAVGTGGPNGAGLRIFQQHVTAGALSAGYRVLTLVTIRDAVGACTIGKRVPTDRAVRHASIVVEELSIKALIAAGIPIAPLAPAYA